MKIIRIHHFNEATDLLQKIGVDPYGIKAMISKTRHVNILLKARPCKVANILKQDMLSLGGDAAVARGSVSCSVEATDVLLMGTVKQLRALAVKITNQPFGLNGIAKEMVNLLDCMDQNRYILKTSRREIVLGERTLIMGVLNITPDSFSDGNQFMTQREAIKRGLQIEDEGADIIDIGGESTRPGSKPVKAIQEINRILPVVEKLSGKLKIPISVDTTKSQVAQKALEAGAEIINDISALNSDRKMGSVIRKNSAAVILMHMRGTPESMQTGDLGYGDLMGEIITYLQRACRKAIKAGIDSDKLIIDPGIGFGKTFDDNCRIIKNIYEMKALGLPILIGTSRKAFIGKVTGGTPQERAEGTAATVTAAIMNGCHIVRVHDVAMMKKVAAMTDAVLRA